MKKLFGTDGIRGVANEYPMTAEMAARVGRAVALFFSKTGSFSKIIIGKDTRISGDMLESAIVSGICSVGANACLVGVLPTPAVAHLTSSFKACAGIMISASHNPFYDNGIKVFNADGYKLTDEQEAEIEKLILDEYVEARNKESRNLGTSHTVGTSTSDYISFLKDAVPADLHFKSLKIVLDCSNGATYRIAPQLFMELGAEVESLAVEPDGTNINEGCGSQHPEELIKAVMAARADIGLAFDGDGDRLIAVDEAGKVLSGDHILAICAKFMKQKGALTNNTVVSTVMSNMGFGAALKKLGIKHEITQVGDRYVVQRMIATGAVLGGEDSGHMIFADHHTTGDGILTALKLIETMHTAKESLSNLSKIITVYPQILMNVDVESKPDINAVPEIMAAVQSVEAALGDNGRVLVRYSGTRPLCRVMVEGANETETRKYCNQIADIIKNNIGIDARRNGASEKR
ncbi:MAG: phosphoglucosamine mutase [Desulfobacterales bacterium]|nr:MAG: phosphoglucosamine mutase [Desulfobacterales bacterium]